MVAVITIVGLLRSLHPDCKDIFLKKKMLRNRCTKENEYAKKQ